MIKSKKKSTTRFSGVRIFVHVKPADVRRYSFQEDREYFSKPVEVELFKSTVSTGMLYVRDPKRDHTYPVCNDALKTFFDLPCKVRSTVGR